MNKDYKELIKKLRSRRVCLQSGGDLEQDFPLMREAADAIEELSDLVFRAIGFWDTAETAAAVREISSYLPDVTDPEWQRMHKAMGFCSPLADVYEMLGVYDDPESENIKKGND